MFLRRDFLVGVHAREPDRVSFAHKQNLAGLNVCRGIYAIGQAVTNPAAAGMIGMIFPAGRKRVLAYVAISAGRLFSNRSV